MMLGAKLSRTLGAFLIGLFIAMSAGYAGLHDMVEMTVLGNPGTGTFQLGSAIPPYLTFAAVSTSGEIQSYHAQDVAGNWENGRGVWTPGSGGGSLTRSVITSSNSNTLVNFGSGSTIVYATTLATDPVTTTYPSNVLTQVTQPICPLSATSPIVSDAKICPTDATKGVGYNSVTLTGASTLALPTHLPAAGGWSTMFMITHSGSSDGPSLGVGFEYPGGAQPPECDGVNFIVNCWSIGTQTDWLPCISIDAAHIGCGSILTNVSFIPAISIVQTATLACPSPGSGDGTGGVTCSSSTLTLTSGNDLIFGIVNCTTTGCSGTGTTTVVTGIAGTNLGSCAALTNTAAAALIKTELWRCHVTGSGSTFGAITWGANAFYSASRIWEVSGLASSPNDGVSATATGTGVTPTAALAGGGATQGNGELIMVAIFCNLGPFTLSGTGWVDDGSGQYGHKFTTATGAQTPTLGCASNTGSNPWATSIAALKHP